MTNKEAIKLLEQQIENFPFPIFEPENERYMDENIEALHMAIADMKFLNYLVNIIPPNEMEDYRSIYKCFHEKNNC